jgi:hypothetical protein
MITREQVRDAIASIEYLSPETVDLVLTAFSVLPDPVLFVYQTTIECYRHKLPVEGNWNDLIYHQLRCFNTPRILADVLALPILRDRIVASHQDQHKWSTMIAPYAYKGFQIEGFYTEKNGVILYSISATHPSIEGVYNLGDEWGTWEQAKEEAENSLDALIESWN